MEPRKDNSGNGLARTVMLLDAMERRLQEDDYDNRADLREFRREMNDRFIAEREDTHRQIAALRARLDSYHEEMTARSEVQSKRLNNPYR